MFNVLKTRIKALWNSRWLRSCWTDLSARFNEADYSALLEKAEADAQVEFDNLIARLDVPGLDNDEQKAIYEKLLREMCDRRDRLHIKPEFTPDIVKVCSGILAFGAAGLGLSLAFANNIDLLTSFGKTIVLTVILFYINLIMTSLLVLGWFFLQARTRYPFLYLKRLGNSMPYFYYQTLDRSRKYNPLQTPRGVYERNRDYLEDLLKFSRYLIEEDYPAKLRNEIQQYYLLIVYQAYLDQYELQLTHLFLYCAVGGTVSALIVGLFYGIIVF